MMCIIKTGALIQKKGKGTFLNINIFNNTLTIRKDAETAFKHKEVQVHLQLSLDQACQITHTTNVASRGSKTAAATGLNHLHKAPLRSTVHY